MEALHEVRDEAKVSELAASIAAAGWQGAPLVADGEQLLTGTHRYAAAKLVGLADDEIPTLDVRDLFASVDLDFDATWTEAEDIYGDWYQAMVYALGQLPTTTRDEYGIDVH
jgi:hypothetical protein